MHLPGPLYNTLPWAYAAAGVVLAVSDGPVLYGSGVLLLIAGLAVLRLRHDYRAVGSRRQPAETERIPRLDAEGQTEESEHPTGVGHGNHNNNRVA